MTQLKGHPMRFGDGVIRNLRHAATLACVELPWSDVTTVMVEGRPLRTRRIRSSQRPSSQHGTMIFSAKKIEATHAWDWAWLNDPASTWVCTSEPKTKDDLLHPGRQRSIMESTLRGDMGEEGRGEGSPSSVSTRNASGCRRRGGGEGDEGGDAR